MKETKHLLIGGGIASSQAAKMLAMKDPGAAVTLVTAEPHLPYDRPALSKELLRGEASADDIFYDPQSFFDEKNIEVLLGESVVGLDPDAHTAILSGGDTITYEKAFIATGGEPVRLQVPGADLEGVHYLRTLDDARAIAGNAGKGRRAVIVGAGFIGMEVAASLVTLGAEVTVVEAEPRIWPHFLDETLSGFVEDYCTARGICFVTGDFVDTFAGNDHVTGVRLASGTRIDCDFVCVGVGIAPRLDLAEAAGLEVDNGIVVDAFLRTSHPDVYAGGDIVDYPDPVFGRRRVEHWGHAEYCGQVAGVNMAGAEQTYDLLSYVWSDVFDLHIEMAGDETERDRIVVRGDLESNSFTVLFLKDDRLRAYFAVNTDKRAFPPMQKLIRQNIDLSGQDAVLADPSSDLKALLKK